MITPEQAAPLFAWMAEREAVRIRKEVLQGLPPAGRAPPMTSAQRAAMGNQSWSLKHLTHDPILSTYRFCNVNRENDRVTVWIRKHVREPYADHPDLWFMLAICRWINWPGTLAELIGSPGLWPTDERLFSLEYAATGMKKRKARGDKVFTGAYLITNNGVSMPKEDYVCQRILQPLWADREKWRRWLSSSPWSMENVHAELQYYNGFGSFIAGQVTTDMRHTRYLRDAHDAATWAAVGPGSARGLNRLAGRPTDARVGQALALEELRAIRAAAASPDALASWVAVPELTDLQNCCCEYDKYERSRLGEGRPRAKYVPGRGY
jgi:hypothetical protein